MINSVFTESIGFSVENQRKKLFAPAGLVFEIGVMMEQAFERLVSWKDSSFIFERGVTLNKIATELEFDDSGLYFAFSRQFWKFCGFCFSFR